MTTVLFVPGSGEDLDSRDYRAVLKAIELQGYETKFVPITWQRTTIDDWVAQLSTEYEQYDPRHTVLAGFSWGAMTAFVTAAKRPPAALWLCSLSPYFSDDQSIKDSLQNGAPKFMGKRRLSAFARLDFKVMAANITSKTLVFMGEKEAKGYPDLKRRCELAASRIHQSRLIQIAAVGHEIDNPKYIDAIVSVI